MVYFQEVPLFKVHFLQFNYCDACVIIIRRYNGENQLHESSRCVDLRPTRAYVTILSAFA